MKVELEDLTSIEVTKGEGGDPTLYLKVGEKVVGTFPFSDIVAGIWGTR